jgi:hypothetical protein
VKNKLLILPLALLVAGFALSACGSSSSGGNEEEAAIEEVIEKSATTTDPSKCTEFQTVEFNEQEAAGATGEEATEQCEEAAEGKEEPAESVEVSNISIEGETATAEAAITGSALDGQTVEIELAKEEGQWKLNQLVGFSEYDGETLAESLEEEFEREGGERAEQASCVGEAFAEISQEEAEEIVFEHNNELAQELFGECE